jgi:hypothetical protein
MVSPSMPARHDDYRYAARYRGCESNRVYIITVIEEKSHVASSHRRGRAAPVGKRNDGLAGTHAAELSAQVLNSLVSAPV